MGIEEETQEQLEHGELGSVIARGHGRVVRQTGYDRGAAICTVSFRARCELWGASDDNGYNVSNVNHFISGVLLASL